MAQSATLSDFAGKRVELVRYNADGEGEYTTEGTVETASEAGIAFKPKGTSTLDVVTPDEIVSINLAPEKLKDVTRRRLNPVDLGKTRQHLADRHGISVEWCNSNTEVFAKEYHDGIDHDDLSHYHAEPEKKDDTPEVNEAGEVEDVEPDDDELAELAAEAESLEDED